MKLNLIIIVGLSALTLGCETGSGDGGGNPVPVVQAPQVAFVVSAAASIFEGADGTPFEGVVIEVPSGAFAAEQEVSLRTVVEEAALPEGAYAVGRQFQLVAEEAPAKALTVTLPVFPEDVQAFGEDFVSVKVWLRGPQDWDLVEPVSTAPASVTIEVDNLGPMAAGVKIRELAGANMDCVTSGDCLSDEVATDIAGSLPHVGLPRLTSSGADVHFVTQKAVAGGLRMTGVKFVAKTTSTQTSTDFTLAIAGDADRNRGMAVDGNGDLWVGSRRGAVVLRYTTASEELLADTLPMASAVTNADSATVAWLTLRDGQLTQRSARSAADIDPPESLTVTLSAGAAGRAASLIAVASQPGSLWVATSAAPGAIWSVVQTGDGLALATSLTLPAGEQAIDLAVDGDTLLALAGPSLTLYSSTAGAAPEKVAGVGRVSAMATTPAGGVWVGLAEDPGTALLFKNQVTDFIRLSDAGPDTPTARAFVPRAITAAEGAVLILTRGGNLLRIDD